MNGHVLEELGRLAFIAHKPEGLEIMNMSWFLWLFLGVG